jgi:antirestriction protein ArdC
MYLFALGIQNGYTDNRWLTFRQALAVGAQVRKGEHGTQICFPATHYEVTKKENGKPVIGRDGQPEKVYVKYDQPRMKYYTVFNAAQVDNMPPQPAREKVNEWTRHERAEVILRESNAVIIYGGDRAFYSPSLDRIQLPTPEQFPSGDRFYATALHELAHWTGSGSRLNREGITGNYEFGSPEYAKEELVAEITSLIVGSELQIGHDPERHASYVQEWVRILEDNPKEILTACSAASKAQDYVLAFEPDRQTEHTSEHTMEHEQTHEQTIRQARPESHNEQSARQERAIAARMRERQKLERAMGQDRGSSHGR